MQQLPGHNPPTAPYPLTITTTHDDGGTDPNLCWQRWDVASPLDETVQRQGQVLLFKDPNDVNGNGINVVGTLYRSVALAKEVQSGSPTVPAGTLLQVQFKIEYWLHSADPASKHVLTDCTMRVRDD